MFATDTIDALHKRLDEHPRDHDTRLILADALEDVPELAHLADGYRALARLGRAPFPNGGSALLERSWATWATPESDRGPDLSELPKDWCDLLAAAGSKVDGSRAGHFMVLFRGRREADDAAAEAFSKLSADRRAELLGDGADGFAALALTA